MNLQVYVVGLIADTHGLLRPEVASALAGVDLIVHAGDIGGPSILDALRAIAPVEAVYGNVDDPHDPALAPERLLPVAGLSLHVSHGHELGSPTPELLAARYQEDILVFGHTHRALVRRLARPEPSPHPPFDRLIVNPGAAGPRRFNLQPSVARLTIDRGRAEAEIIWLV